MWKSAAHHVRYSIAPSTHTQAQLKASRPGTHAAKGWTKTNSVRANAGHCFNSTGSCAGNCFNCIPLAWTTVASTGQALSGGQTWGALRTPDGVGYIYDVVPLSDTTSPYAPEVPPLNPPYNATSRPTRTVSLRKPDIPTLHYFSSSGRAFLINNMEDYPATMYVSEVVSNPTTGLLSMTAARALPAVAPDSPWWFLCAGSVTPWGTKLVGEEFPPDARYAPYMIFDQPGYDGLAAMNEVRAFGYYGGNPMSEAGAALPSPFPSKGDILTNATLQLEAAASIKPYNYGATGEVLINADGSTAVRKLWTMGRLSHELALVLPDNRTVLSTDDMDGNGALVMFVADTAGDLTAGTLYAAKFSNQKPPLDPETGAGAEWDVSWIPLAHATQAELDAMRTTLKFDDIFDAVNATVVGQAVQCPAGYARANSMNWEVEPGNFRAECLKLKLGMKTAAAFFETRRYAALIGATVEFSKEEGMAVSEELGTIYMTTSRMNHGMLDGAILTDNYTYVYDISAARDDIRLSKQNLCGGVIEFDTNPAGGSWAPVRARIAITGKQVPGDPSNTCDTARVAGPDNLFFIPGTSTLIIAEDPGSKQHANPMMWAVDVLENRPAALGSPWPLNPKMTRIMTSPLESEITGPNTGRVGDWMYLMAAVQNPDDAQGKAAPGLVGYIGPIPTQALLAARQARQPLSPPAANALVRLQFGEVPVPTGAAKTQVVATNQVCVW